MMSQSRWTSNELADVHTSLADWRLATMKATSVLRGDGDVLARAAREAIESFFEIYEPKSATEINEQAQLLQKLCKDAVDLNMMMRSAKDEYLVKVPHESVGKPISDCENIAEEESSHPGRYYNGKPGTIAYFITGALIKKPYDNPADVKVLEMAQAAVYVAEKET